MSLYKLSFSPCLVNSDNLPKIQIYEPHIPYEYVDAKQNIAGYTPVTALRRDKLNRRLRVFN